MSSFYYIYTVQYQFQPVQKLRPSEQLNLAIIKIHLFSEEGFGENVVLSPSLEILVP